MLHEIALYNSQNGRYLRLSVSTKVYAIQSPYSEGLVRMMLYFQSA